jgi:hypothetical protein
MISYLNYHIPRHTPRSVVDKVDFVSSFGYGPARDTYPGSRGLPGLLVTDLGAFTWPGDGGDMQVESLHPGVTPDDLRKATGFAIEVPDDVEETAPPAPEELDAIRNFLDPLELRHGKAAAAGGARLAKNLAGGLVPPANRRSAR